MRAGRPCCAVACRASHRARPALHRLPLLHLLLNLAVVTGALAAEAVFGYPDALFRAIRHPVVWIGALLASPRPPPQPARALCRGRRRLHGFLSLALAAILAAPRSCPAPRWRRCRAGRLSLCGFAGGPGKPLPAQRSLHGPMSAPSRRAGADGLAAGRRRGRAIVGRDPDSLDEAGVVRAAIESLAENFADGVVAPAFWGALPGSRDGGLQGDQHRGQHGRPPHPALRGFGWAAARFDDLVNLPASRLAALWLVLAALPARADPRRLRAVWRDAAATARPMRAGRKPPWRGRSACASPGRAATAASWCRMPGWATAAPRRPRPTCARRSRSTAAPARSSWSWPLSRCRALIARG